MRPILLCLLSLALPVSAEPAAAPTSASTATLRARLTDGAIRQAVRETLAETPREAKAAPSGQVLSADRYQAISREFSAAQKPSCLGPDALRHQPSGFSTKNWTFGAGGLFALPFWVAAIAGGKCQ